MKKIFYLLVALLISQNFFSAYSVYAQCNVSVISTTSTNNLYPQIDGNTIVWQGIVGGTPHIFKFDGTTVTQVSTTSTNNLDPQIDGNTIVWSGLVGGTYHIFKFDGTTVTQVSTTSTNNNHPQIEGNTIVWEGTVGGTSHIFKFDGTNITQVSTTSTNNVKPQISGNTIVWESGAFPNTHIFKSDGTTVSQVSTTTSANYQVQIDGNTIVWQAYDGTNYHIYKFDGTTVTQVSTTTTTGSNPQIIGNTIIYSGFLGGVRHIYKFDGTTVTQVSNSTSTSNNYPQIDGNTIVWEGTIGGVLHIFKSDGTTVTQVSNSGTNNRDLNISGNTIAWNGNDGTTNQIYYQKVTTPATATETMTWTGAISTDWHNACNWSPNGVPTATNAVIIPATTNDPIISSGTSVAKRVEITGSGASLTINVGATLTVSSDANDVFYINNAGHLTNRGTLNVTNTYPTSNSRTAMALGSTNTPTADNYGTINLTSSQNLGLELGTNATFQNYSGGNININASGGMRGDGAITNNASATITIVGSNFGFQFGGTLTNSGLIDVTGQIESGQPTSQIINNACGIIKLTGAYFNGSQTTTNNGFMSIGGTLHNTSTGTFANNGVLKYLALDVSSSFTNNKMLITNTCPIFTLGGSNNYTVNGIFTDAGATTSAGTYTSVGNKFTANNTIPTGTQTLYTQVTDGTCTFVVPFSFNNVKPTAVSVNNTSVCAGTSVTLSATCASGTITWYDAASGTSIALGTGTGFTTIPVTNPTTYYASCETTNCNGGRMATSAVTVKALPTASPSSDSPKCEGTTLGLTSTTATSYLWTGPNSFSSTVQNPSISNVSIVAGGTYTLRVTNAGGCTATATTAVVINSTSAPTSPTATPSNFTVAGTTTLTATGCNSPSTITWYDSANPTVALPNNTPTISANKTFFARCTGTNTCVSDPSTNVSVTYNPCTPLGTSPGNVSITWTGLISTDWKNACNWNPAWVPDATNAEVVIDLHTNQPIVSGTVPPINIMYVNEGATLTVASGGTLTVNQSGAGGYIFMQDGSNSIINDGTINVGAGTGGFGISVTGSSSNITNRGTIKTNNLNGILLIVSSNLTILNESTGIINSDFRVLGTSIMNLTNHGTINYSGSAGATALSLNSASSLINDGIINITTGSGISNPSGSIITNNACGKILVSAGNYTSGGTTTNNGLIQMPNTLNFTNSGTFTNNGVLKANAVSAITNNKMVITNACPIFTLGGSNNYTVNGIFTNEGATTSAGTYTSVGNKFIANNTIPTGTQTLYAQVTDGTCTFVVPFDFNNVKPTAVSVNNTNVCAGTSVTLSATCASGTITWYDAASGTSIALGTGTGFATIPVANPTTYYASCESGTPPATNCASGRVATSAVTVNANPTAPTGTSNLSICNNTTASLSATCTTGTITWYDASSVAIPFTGSPFVTPNLTANTTYNVRCESGSCTSAFVPVTVSINPTATVTQIMTWTGTVSTDWNNACNWSPNGVPTATNRVNIPNVANDPVIGNGIVAVAKEIILTGNGSLSVSSSGSLTVASGGNDITFEGYGNTLTNDGTINVGNGSGIGFAFRDLRYNEYGRGSIITNRGTINANNAGGGIVLSGSHTSLHVVNESAGIINGNFIITGGEEFELTNYGTINYSSGDNWAFDLSASLTDLAVNNYGTIRITSGTGIKVGEGSMVNQPCGKIIMTAGDYLDNNSSGDGTSNFGLMVLSNNLNTTVSLFVNRGVLKYGSLTGAVNNSSVIVNNSLPIFTYGGTYNGTINGIFTNAAATTSAGTFTAPNTFVPSGLPAGSQTLYAKITPSGGACSYVVPFTYNNVAKKLFVKADATGANIGASWTDAFTNLQSALAIAITGDEIWVAKGTYKPTADAAGNTAPTDPRTKTFVMKDGVKIYGSFAGTEANLSERTLAVMAANPAILSGDFNGDDVVSGSGSTLSITGNAENSIHVIDNNYTSGNPLTATAVLDGFVITGGNANAGGGMSNSNASPSLSNLTFSGNNAFGGGGMSNFNSNPVLKSITFSNNMANIGGGMHNYTSIPSLINVSFSGNNATTQGGGMINVYFGPSLSNVSFFNNNATNDGGAIFNALGASPNISNSIFWGNTKNGNANAIGADIFNESGTTTVKNTLLQSPNTASNYPKTGDGKFVFPDASNIFAQNPLFVNATDPDGADNILRTADDGLMLSVCSPAINAGNNADIPSGITTDIVGNPRTFNTTVDMGAYELQANQDIPTLTVGTIPAICSGATSFTIPYTATTGTPTTYSISGTGITTVTDGTLPSGSITVSLSAAASGTSIPFTLTVKNASGCASANISGSVTVNANTLYVDASNIIGRQDGTSWATAYTKLQDAIDAATTFGCGVEIYVAASTYLPTKDMTGNASPSDNRTKTFYIKKDGIKIYGGYPAGGGTRNVATNVTILSGDFNWDDVVSGSGSTLSFSNNTENAYHVVHIDGTTSNGNITAATLLDGFRISGGNANGVSFPNNTGGGVFNDGRGTGKVCSPTFANCTLSSNSATFSGGGMYNSGNDGGTSSPSLTNCTLNGNKAGSFSGGMANNGNRGTSRPSLTNCTLSGNSANDGGGMYNSGSDGTSRPSLTNCTLSGNSSTTNGGGMANNSSSPSLTNCTLSGNSATNGGGMFNGNDSSPSLSNCTLSGNSASQGGGIYNSFSVSTSRPILSNCILWSNGSNQIVNNNAMGTTINYSIYDDGTPNGTLTLPTGVTGGNNLDSNPLFTDAANGNYTLTSCSPAINAGSNAAIPSGITTDLAGNPRRYNNGTVDMGAYELQANQNIPMLTVVGTIPSICSGATSFTIPYTATTGTPTSYSISGTGITTVTDGALPSGSITVNLSAAASGTSIPFTLTVKNASGCTSASITGSVAVNATPVATANSNSPICSGTTLNLTGGGTGTYSWSGPNSFTSTVQNPTFLNVATTDAGTYTVTVTGAGACTSTATVMVTINATPTAPTGTSNPSICNNTKTSLSATCATGTVKWYGSDSATLLHTGSPFATPNLSTATTYNVRCENGTCMSGFVAVNVSINGVTAPTGTSSPSICSGATASLTATCGSGNVAWYGSNSTSLLSTVSPYVTSNLSSATTYNVRCESGSCQSAFVAVNISIENPPNAQIAGTDNLSCSVTSVTRTASGGNSYSWSSGLGNNALATISQSGTYTVTVTSANGCTATATTVVTIDDSVPNAQIAGTDNLSCSVNSVSRTASGGVSYVWSNGLGSSALATISQSGTYTVTVTNSNGCTATAMTVVIFNNDLPVTASNTGPYQIGNTISLSATGGETYSWAGPNSFTSNIANPMITNALQVNSGIYTVTVTSGACTATATTNVVVNGLEPCSVGVEYQFVKAGNPYKPLFVLTNGMSINQLTDAVSILAVPVCATQAIESIEMRLQGPSMNHQTVQNISPYAIFNNTNVLVHGRVLLPGTYTLTVRAYSQDNLQGTLLYGPTQTTFTILPNTATISQPSLSSNALCSGSSFNVNFTSTGVFNPSNQFKVELSDTNGNFESLVNIGNTSNIGGFIQPIVVGLSNSSGTITCTIPSSVEGGTNYRVRVISTDGVSSSTVSLPFTIHPKNLVFVSPTNDILTNVGTKQASQTITATNKVTSPAKINYQAGKSITLNAGFEAKAGTVFQAQIGGCN